MSRTPEHKTVTSLLLLNQCRELVMDDGRACCEGSMDPYSRAPRSPKAKQQTSKVFFDTGLTAGPQVEDCKSPSVEQVGRTIIFLITRPSFWLFQSFSFVYLVTSVLKLWVDRATERYRSVKNSAPRITIPKDSPLENPAQCRVAVEKWACKLNKTKVAVVLKTRLVVECLRRYLTLFNGVL